MICFNLCSLKLHLTWNSSKSSFFSLHCYQQTKITESIHKSQIPETIMFPHTLCDYLLKEGHIQPEIRTTCYVLSHHKLTTRTLDADYQQQYKMSSLTSHPPPCPLHWFHLNNFAFQKHLCMELSNRIHGWMWSETCCGLLGIQFWDFWVDVEGLTVSCGNFSPLLTAITYSLPV